MNNTLVIHGNFTGFSLTKIFDLKLLLFKDASSKKLSDISTIDCERFRLAIIDKYSSNYAKNMWSRFKACLGYAERLGYIDRVPFKGLDNPRGKHPDTKFWTFDEFKKVINSFDISEYRDSIIT